MWNLIEWLRENLYHTTTCDKGSEILTRGCICGKNKAIKEVEQLQAEYKLLLERVKFAIDVLPECPEEAKDFLTPALKGK